MSFSKTKQDQSPNNNNAEMLLTIDDTKTFDDDYDDDSQGPSLLGTKRKETIVGATPTVQLNSPQMKNELVVEEKQLQQDGQATEPDQNQPKVEEKVDPRGKPPPVRARPKVTVDVGDDGKQECDLTILQQLFHFDFGKMKIKYCSCINHPNLNGPLQDSNNNYSATKHTNQLRFTVLTRGWFYVKIQKVKLISFVRVHDSFF
jgi:hypothetical protein